MSLYFSSNLARIVLIYAGAIVAGYTASRLGVPLPWMIGPMVLAGATALLGWEAKVPWITRPVGQLVVAASVGLAFTPAALAALSEHMLAMVAAALLTIAAGFLAAALLMRTARLDAVSAGLACVPGGPVEMASLASRHGVDPGPVAFAQTLRIALIVLIIPPLLTALNGAPAPGAPAALPAGGTDALGAALLLAIALGASLGLRAVRLTSPFFLGPLAGSAVASALLLPVAPPPSWLLASAQVLLGVWLGRMLRRELFVASRGLVPAVLASTVLLMALCGGMALGISALTGLDWQTAVLATAPGSVTEMALTAKILEKGVAFVAAYHLVRIFIIIPLAPLIFGLTARIANRSP